MTSRREIQFNIAKTKLREPIIRYRHRNLRPNDVFVASYPRSGSTWLRFLLFDLLSGIEADFPSVQLVIPDIENQLTAIPLLPNSGRLLKTHERYQKEYRKAIYLIRDVRDVLISEYFFWLRKGVFTGDLQTFFNKFLFGKVNPYGFWGNHVNSWLESPAAMESRVLFIKFEDMRRDTEAILFKITQFLGVDQGFEAIAKAVKNSTIDRMREKETHVPEGIFNIDNSEIRFIREGSSGSWQEMLTPEQVGILEERLGNILSWLGYSLYSKVQHN